MESKAKISLIIIAVFLIGFFTGTGVVATFLYINKPPVPFGKPFAGGPPPGGSERLMERMTRSLDLSPDQQKEVRQIMDKTRDQMMNLREKNRPAIRSVLEQSQKDISAVLTDEQKQRFKNLTKKMKKRFGRMEERRKGLRKDRRSFGPPPDSP